MSIARPTHGQPHARETLTHGEPPPGAPEAEKQLVGAALMVPANIPLIHAAVSHRDWTDARCRTAWSHLMAMHAAGEPIDLVSVLLHCRAAGDEEAVGGSVQLARWANDCICPRDPRDKIAIVAERGAKREAFFALVEGARACQNGQALGDVLGDVRGRLDAIGSASGAAPSRFSIARMTSREFDDGHYAPEYLVDDILAAREPMVIAAGMKTMKTTLAVGLALSLSLATPYLGAFPVRRAVRVLLFSGESGWGTLQSAARRIAENMGHSLSDAASLLWSRDLPRIGNLLHEDELRAALQRDEIEVVIIDPLNFCLPGSDAGNLMVMGALLRSLSQLCEEIGVTLIVIHHVKKSVVNPYAPPELSDVSWSGTAEWARQWILLARREAYVPGSGQHKLWMSVGGSAGHGSLHGLDIDEGVFPNRRWAVDVLRPEDVHEANEGGKEAAKEAKKREQIERDKTAIIAAVGKLPEHRGTKTDIRTRAARNGQAFSLAFAELLNDGSLVACEIAKNNRTEKGFRLSDGPE